MDNRITLLGIVHFKKINGIRSTRFNIIYLSSGIQDDIKIKRIEAYGNERIVTGLTNGMMAIITGQLLYSEEKHGFNKSRQCFTCKGQKRVSRRNDYNSEWKFLQSYIYKGKE